MVLHISCIDDHFKGLSSDHYFILANEEPISNIILWRHNQKGPGSEKILTKKIYFSALWESSYCTLVHITMLYFQKQTGINSSSNDTAQRVPGSVVKPVVELVETFLCQILGCAVVEVGIKLMDNTFKP